VTEPAPAVYQLRGLSKTYNGRTVVDIASLDIYRSEILGLVGPSGAGKSTLLRLLNFLEAPSSGEIVFEGERCSQGQPMALTARRRVTTVFQRPLLLDRTVLDNVAYGLRLRGDENAKSRSLQALEEVGLARLAGQRARTLSGGEAQRVALARAIVIRPAVLLLDEPTANLDPYNAGLIEQIIRQLNLERQMTLVLVTHNVFQAHRLATRAALLLEGRVIEVAESERFFSHPSDPRTLAFVQGEMVY
jgi:tungstate transport system ATP-binding protein